jgi:hypothetical protein
VSPADSAKRTPSPEGPAPARISRDDIEAKFRELQGDVDEVADQAVSYVLVAGAAIVVGVVVVAWMLGRRRGRKKTTIVEVRRL